MYKELVLKSLHNRNTIVPINEITYEPRDYEAYQSLFQYSADIYEYVHLQGGVSGFNGKLYTNSIYLDIDNATNGPASRDSLIKLIRYLNSEYKIHPDDLKIYFSGNKGYHVEIPEIMLGEIKGSEVLNQYVKDFVTKIKVGSQVTDIDTAIYDATRIFRLVNSKNMKSGLYKIPIGYNEVVELGDAGVRDLAKEPRLDWKLSKTYSPKFNPKLSDLWESVAQREAVVDLGVENMDSFFAPATEGGRNTKYFAQVTMLLEKGLYPDAVFQIVQNANQLSGNPIPDVEMQTIMRHAQEKLRRKAVTKKAMFKPLSELLPEWEQEQLDETNPIWLGFKRIDDDMKGKLRGKLIVVAGYAGSKKSLFCQQVLLKNIKDGKQVGLYSSMEMSSSTVLDRTISQSFTNKDYIGSVSEAVRKAYQAEKQSAREFIQKNIVEMYGSRLMVSSDGSMDSSHYRQALLDTRERLGRVDILVVDGLSMMNGGESELSAANKHTKELKELAIEFNLAVFLIVHASRGESLDARDLRNKIRGSEKVIDNSDCAIYLSQIVDPELTIDNLTEYSKNQGYIRCYNKRGSGNYTNVVYDFDQKTLLMTESDTDPRTIEVKGKKGSGDDGWL